MVTSNGRGFDSPFIFQKLKNRIMWVLTFEKDNKAVALVEKVSIQDLQRERTKLKLDPKYRGGKLVVRTIKGFKNKKY